MKNHRESPRVDRRDAGDRLLAAVRIVDSERFIELPFWRSGSSIFTEIAAPSEGGAARLG